MGNIMKAVTFYFRNMEPTYSKASQICIAFLNMYGGSYIW